MEQKFLEEWRKGKYWSISHLASEAGINKSIISRIESGKFLCRIETAKKIADALGILPEQILDFKEMFVVKSVRLTAINQQADYRNTGVSVPALSPAQSF